ncbi:MAG: OsmC family peroxiredoxin [Nevskiaceae bacterium]|nr:MAG: OsmC family peroxiredoxin [Nevskiaceae bacterium]TAM24989.1 MAG: OsmC family peroxiredoxin [Nevskiaceae bacterium]
MISVRKAPQGKLAHQISVGSHQFITDVGLAEGGDGLGPDPHDLLDSALGACTALTVMMVARRKQMPLEDVQVTISHVDADGLYRLNRQIRFVGALSAEQRDYLLAIANKCPIHRALHGRFEVETVLAAG